MRYTHSYSRLPGLALDLGQLNSPRVAPLPTPSVRFPHLIIKFATGRTAPDSRLPRNPRRKYFTQLKTKLL
ncbi:hypothetical protein BJP36_35990 [Moorena producens JHB]|uniref:Uncharacterized protein n=1 Tax=Moorena producens (strain JHB) TaxID=1454205 RepID=A0A9Q9UW54_MOOP1|nr:hypothetical protein [Moorena producens]WAN69496.1 hypothetical protein BJP36_35990 [Moorena producens JHB]